MSAVGPTPVNGDSGSCVDITIKNLFSSLGIDSSQRTEIESINLSYKYLTEKEVRVLGRGLADARSLRTVKLGSNLLGDKGAAVISSFLYENHTITCLDLGFNKISDSGVQALADALCVNSSLTSLYLSGNEISGAGFAHLERALNNNRALKMIYLSGNDMGMEGATHLSNAVRNNASLETIHIGGNKFGADGVKVFSSALVGQNLDAPNHLNLTNLHLSDNNMGDLGATALSDSLKEYRKLQFLDLSFNNITHLGANALSHALYEYTTLETLQIDNNRIRDNGAKYIAAAVPTMSRLSNLNIGFNEIGTDGIQDLLNASSVPMFRLQSLAFSGNSMNDTSSMRLAARLTKDCVLRELYLDHMSIGQTGEKNITSGIIANAAHTALRRLRGFALGPVLAKMGQEYEDWTELGNDQVLKRLQHVFAPPSSMCSSTQLPCPSTSAVSSSSSASSSSSSSSALERSSSKEKLLYSALQLMRNGSSYGYNNVTEKGSVIHVEAFPSSIMKQGSNQFPHAVPLAADEGAAVAEVVPCGKIEGVFKQEIISIMDVNVSSSFTLSEEDIAMLLSDSDPCRMPAPQGMQVLEGTQDKSSSQQASNCPLISSAISDSITNCESYAPILRSIKDLVSLPFEISELIKLDKYYIAKNEMRNDEERSHCSGISTPDSCYESEDGGQTRKGSRKRSTFDREVEDMESRLSSGNNGTNGTNGNCNGTSTNNSSSDDFGGVKKAANVNSLSRISQYPRLRGLSDELKRNAKHEDLLILLRQLRFLEQYEQHSIAEEKGSGKSLLPLEIEAMVLKVYEERG